MEKERMQYTLRHFTYVYLWRVRVVWCNFTVLPIMSLLTRPLVSEKVGLNTPLGKMKARRCQKKTKKEDANTVGKKKKLVNSHKRKYIDSQCDCQEFWVQILLKQLGFLKNYCEQAKQRWPRTNRSPKLCVLVWARIFLVGMKHYWKSEKG